MSPAVVGIVLIGALFAGMLILFEAGRRIGLRHLQKDPEGARAGIGTLEGGVFALLGLLIAFTFSGAAERFDRRRLQIVDEANAIGTAYLRVDLLPEASRPAMRERFKTYVDLRLDVYRKLPDLAAAEQALDRSTAVQGEIWSGAVAGCRGESPPCAMLLLPALNEMIDIATTRTVAARIHAPWVIFALLFALALVASLLAGYGSAGSQTHSWTHVLVFVAIMTASIYLILDLEYPRFGLIRLDQYDKVLVDVRQSMK